MIIISKGFVFDKIYPESESPLSLLLPLLQSIGGDAVVVKLCRDIKSSPFLNSLFCHYALPHYISFFIGKAMKKAGNCDKINFYGKMNGSMIRQGKT